MFVHKLMTGSTSPAGKSLSARRDSGFSLLEMSVVLAIAMLASSIFFINMRPAMENARVNNAYNITLSTLRQARDLAVSKRGTYVVTFTAPRTIKVTQQTDTGTQVMSVSLPTDMSFVIVPTLPNPGPDQFGTGVTAIDFDQGVTGGTPTQIWFNPDGSSQDKNSNYNNGVVYIARPGQILTSRAITVWGLTGRIRGWRLYQGGSSSYAWRQQ